MVSRFQLLFECLRPEGTDCIAENWHKENLDWLILQGS